MGPQVCPDCGAQVLPGQPACRRCGFDFILGRKPGGKPSVDRSRILLLLGSGMAVVLTTLVLFARGGDDDGSSEPPCVLALRKLQPSIASAAARGNSVPSCGLTPPHSRDCWEEAGVFPSLWPDDERLGFVLQGGSRWEIDCQTDMDADGVPGVWKATAEVVGIKVSAPGTR